MSNIKTKLDFSRINTALNSLGALTDAAETHGIICAYICSGTDEESLEWLEPILALEDIEEALNNKNGQLLLELYQFSLKQLQSFEFDLFLLLPDEDTTIAERSEAIGAWCQGLLTGLAMAEAGIRKDAPEELTETLQDLTKITLIDYEDADNNEENEMAFVEVVEFVRMATLLIHSVLNSPSLNATQDEIASDRIH